MVNQANIVVRAVFSPSTFPSARSCDRLFLLARLALMCPRYVPTQSKRLQLISETSVRAIEENECSLWSTGPLKSHPGIGHTQLSCMRPGKGQSVVFLRLCREFPLNLLLASASLYHDNLQIQVKKISPHLMTGLIYLEQQQCRPDFVLVNKTLGALTMQ